MPHIIPNGVRRFLWTEYKKVLPPLDFLFMRDILEYPN